MLDNPLWKQNYKIVGGNMPAKDWQNNNITEILTLSILVIIIIFLTNRPAKNRVFIPISQMPLPKGCLMTELEPPGICI